MESSPRHILPCKGCGRIVGVSRLLGLCDGCEARMAPATPHSDRGPCAHCGEEAILEEGLCGLCKIGVDNPEKKG